MAGERRNQGSEAAGKRVGTHTGEGWPRLACSTGNPLGKSLVRTGGDDGENRGLLSTLHLELLQPLDGRSVWAGHWGSGGHEDQAGQQCQEDDEPLGIHCGGSEVLAVEEERELGECWSLPAYTYIWLHIIFRRGPVRTVWASFCFFRNPCSLKLLL